MKLLCSLQKVRVPENGKIILQKLIEIKACLISAAAQYITNSRCASDKIVGQPKLKKANVKLFL
jgi:hypothetical protein